ncbi:hypothetical protein [Francisella sp. 19X1-34]|uniref:TackOD1 domain-containing metal-binding protein n=1 Tax=Francisella sp. 19X1-34 TaxID=3087177 RepID=UPI002E32C5C9|nr:hypothetical protein [Francisella sp. 19X1-34]MED7787500.1 hypothetical protein [Francisella sp. 19X1-34]
MTKVNKVVTLDKLSSKIREELSYCEVITISLDDQINETFEDVDAFILNTNDLQDFLHIIRKIRASVYTYLKPVFCVDASFVDYTATVFTTYSALEKFIDMVDDEVNTIEEISQKKDNIKQDWQARLLIYLYTRKHVRTIDARSDFFSKSFFSYPVIDVFCQTKGFDSFEWIKELSQRQIIKSKSLVKSFFCCSSCHSARALFSERCPDCKSENILLADFLHCYTCGNIAPEVEFMRDDELVCSQCKTKLKHIGHDYDRPLESYSCNDCESIFVEPEVITECLDCGFKTLTEKMIKQKISNYELTKKAHHYIKMNLLEYSMSIFDDINYIAPEFFYSLIEWACLMQKRNSAYEFSLIHINIFEYITMMGVSNISKKLREILRKTDMLTRVGSQDIWIWLPNTDLSGAEIVAEKLRKINVLKDVTAEKLIAVKTFHSAAIDTTKKVQTLLRDLANKR